MDRKEFHEIDVHSESGREILGYIPHWIVRTGISVIFIVIAFLLLGSWFFKYPDIIRATIVLTAKNPPAAIFARTDGKLQVLFVEDKQKLEKGQWIGVIENTSDHNDVLLLKKELSVFRENLKNSEVPPFHSPNKQMSLGDLQQDYFKFVKACNDYQLFSDFDYYSEKTRALNNELELHRSYFARQNKQKAILDKDLQLSKADYHRDSILLSKGSISRTEFENRLSAYLKKQYEFESLQLELSREKIQMLQLEQKILDIEMEYEEESRDIKLSVQEAFENLHSQLDGWEQKFVLKTPINGLVTFSNIWNVNHNVVAGEKVMTIVPDSSSAMIGRMHLPVKGSAKVKPGLEVNIRFDNYSPSEYGIVKARVDEISLIPEDNFYIVEVSLPEGLQTSYRKTLEFHPEMQGNAEIITEDVRLLMRIVQPLKALFKNQ